MMSRIFRLWFPLCWGIAVAFLPSTGSAEVKSVVPAETSSATTGMSASAQAERASVLLSEKRYQDALDAIQNAVALDPKNLEYQYTMGGIYLWMQRLEEAEAIYRALIAADGKLFLKAYFNLANIFVQTKRNDQALEALKTARSLDPGRADYEMGVIQIRLKKYREALELLQKAEVAKPELATISRIQQAVAWYYMKEYPRSKELLKQVLASELSVDRAEDVKKILHAVESAMKGAKPWIVYATTGFQYDSNVVLNPLDKVNQSVGGAVSNQSDFVYLLSAGGKYNFYSCDSWIFGAAYNHYQLVYFNHPEMDLLGARPSVYADWEHAPFFAHIEYLYGHYFVDSFTRTATHSVQPKLVWAPTSQWRTEIDTGVEWRLYYDKTPEDRHYFTGITQMYLMKDGRANIRATYQMEYDDFVPRSSGDYVSHNFIVGTQWPILNTKWLADFAGRYVWRPYNFDPSFSTVVKRKDNEQDLSVTVTGPLPEKLHLPEELRLSLIFQQVWNDSNLVDSNNVDPYQYRRSIVSCLLTYTY